MLKELKTQHRSVARLRFEGLTPPEIASRLTMSVQTVYNILRDPLCKSYIAGLNDKADTQVLNVRKELAGMQSKALNGLNHILDNIGSVPATVLRQTSVDVLNYNGYKPVEVREIHNTHMTKDDISELFSRMKAQKDNNPQLNDPNVLEGECSTIQ